MPATTSSCVLEVGDALHLAVCQTMQVSVALVGRADPGQILHPERQRGIAQELLGGHDPAMQQGELGAVARRRVVRAGRASRRPPAPGVLRATTFGLPGRYLPMWRATSRMMLSLPPPGVVPTWIDTGLPAGKGAAAWLRDGGVRGGRERGDEQRAR